MRRKIILLGLILIIATPSIWFLTQQSGTVAPDFTLTDIDGNVFSLSDFSGKVILIDFMNTGCGSCREQIPHFKVIHEEYGNEVVIMSIAINPRESVKLLRSFIEQFPYATWIWAKDGYLAEVYKVIYIPSVVIIDKMGILRFTHRGVTEASTLNREISQLYSE